MVPLLRKIALARPETRFFDSLSVLKAVWQRQLSQGKILKQFEKGLRERIGTKSVSAVSSCTTGLQLILAALELPPETEVIVPNFTFPATINVVLQERMRPVLVDIDLADFCIDPESLRAAITPHTKVAIVVHAFGHPANMDKIMEITNEHGILVIEDAACAIGSRIRERNVGTFGLASAFSFHPRKVLTTGEGGAVATNDDNLKEKMELLRSHGGVRGDYFMTFLRAGFNFRMSDINAALGLSQLRRLGRIIAKRNSVSSIYRQLLVAEGRLTLPSVKPGITHTFQSYVVLLAEGINRDSVIAELRERGVESTLGTYALSPQPAYQGIASRPVPLDYSEDAFRRALALPMSSSMNRSKVRKVTRALIEALDTVQQIRGGSLLNTTTIDR